MKAKQLLILVFFVMTVFSCGKDDNTDLFDNSSAVDLNEILQAYDWYQHSEDEDKEKLLLQKIASGMPDNNEFWLFDDTSFVIHVPEYAGSQQPFLANAEDFYNSCVYAWNIWSNQEIWYRGHTADLLREDEDVKSSIRGISTDFIRDRDVRRAANHARDSLLMVMDTNPKEWDEEFNPMDIIINFANVVESGEIPSGEAMSKETVKNYGKSVRSKLLNIAKEENVFYQTILTRYFQERRLGLSHSA